jgi:uncharacterized protein YneF (UPF0154 family)
MDLENIKSEKETSDSSSKPLPPDFHSWSDQEQSEYVISMLKFYRWKDEFIEGFEKALEDHTDDGYDEEINFDFGSHNRVWAIGRLLSYLKSMQSFAEENPKFEEQMIHMSLSQVLERTLPIPPDIYEQVIDAIVEDEGDWCSSKYNLETVINFAEKKRKSSRYAREFLHHKGIKKSMMKESFDKPPIKEPCGEDVDKKVKISRTPSEIFRKAQIHLTKLNKLIFRRIKLGKPVQKGMRKFRNQDISLKNKSQLGRET